jgi:hypothetical protein
MKKVKKPVSMKKVKKPVSMKKVKKPVKKLPEKLKSWCRRLKIKTTTKIGGRRVQKSVEILKKQIKRKIRTIKM